MKSQKLIKYICAVGDSGALSLRTSVSGISLFKGTCLNWTIYEEILFQDWCVCVMWTCNSVYIHVYIYLFRCYIWWMIQGPQAGVWKQVIKVRIGRGVSVHRKRAIVMGCSQARKEPPQPVTIALTELAHYIFSSGPWLLSSERWRCSVKPHSTSPCKSCLELSMPGCLVPCQWWTACVLCFALSTGKWLLCICSRLIVSPFLVSLCICHAGPFAETITKGLAGPLLLL